MASPSALSSAQLDEILRDLEALSRDRLALYSPYAKQLSFHAAGARHRERLLRAGNQNGKTFCGGSEMAMHLTGEYPSWWPGKRFRGPIVGWAGGVTGETTRDNPQRVLMGPLSEWGTGTIPARCIGKHAPARSVADLLDYVRVRHVTGGWSLLRFKYYEQGREKWQGPGVDAVWFDEEPPPEIYSEGLARTIATLGIAFMTFTPLLGMSDVVKSFLLTPTPDRHDTNMTIEDAEHIPAEERARIIASFPLHEREARAKGVPVLGSGRIFPVPESLLEEGALDIPKHWPRICGLDFGWDHPTAAVWIAWDRDADVVHVYDCYRVREQTPVVHAAALKARGKWIPAAWPHDAYQHDKGSGEQLAQQYRDQGANMLPEHAQYEDAERGNAVEAGLMDMLDRMQTGRWKVAKHLSDWWEEFRLYHRKDGKVVKEGDDLMAASRYALMMLRFAKVKPNANGELKYQRLGYY